MTISQKVRKYLNIKNRTLCGGKNLKIISDGYEVENFKMGSKNKLVVSEKSNECLQECTKCKTSWWGSKSKGSFFCVQILWDGVPLEVLKKSFAFKKAKQLAEGGK